MWNNNESRSDNQKTRALRCPYCEWIIPKQLIDQLLQDQSSNIICELCGNEIKQEFYDLNQLRRYQEGKTINYPKLIKKKGKKLYSALKSKYLKFVKKEKD
ncbi:MAG: hypothetical protein ACOC44_14575 [Promethearchaeia archaeon]